MHNTRTNARDLGVNNQGGENFVGNDYSEGLIILYPFWGNGRSRGGEVLMGGVHTHFLRPRVS